MLAKEEKQRLSKIGKKSLYASGVNSTCIKYSFNVAKRYLVDGSILELGPAEGIMTEMLQSQYRDQQITVVEGAETFCQNLKERYPQINVINSLFEIYSPQKTFDNIIMGHVLEHVDNPLNVLRLARTWLTPKIGRLFAAVPNSNSLHRQAAVLMGLLAVEDELNQSDIIHGHRRVFNPNSFQKVFLDAGFTIEILGGYWIKPLSNKQIEEQWTEQMIDSYMRLGEQYPDIAGELFIVASTD